MLHRTQLVRGHRERAGLLSGDMLKVDLPLFMLAGSLVIGIVAGLLDAQSHNLSDPWSILGVWLAAGISVAAIALLPVLLIGLCWNAIVSRLLGQRDD